MCTFILGKVHSKQSFIFKAWHSKQNDIAWYEHYPTESEINRPICHALSAWLPASERSMPTLIDMLQQRTDKNLSTSFKMFITQVCCVFRPAFGCCTNLKASAAPESWSKYFLLAVLRLFSSFCLFFYYLFCPKRRKKMCFYWHLQVLK